MARFSAGARATGAGTTTLPTQALYATANGRPILREVAVFNTTTNACIYELVTLNTAGTPGAGLTEGKWADQSGAPDSVAFQAFSSTAPTIDQRLGILFPLAAFVGAGVIRTFPGDGIRVPVGTANGIGLIVHTGTGQICDIDWSWDE